MNIRFMNIWECRNKDIFYNRLDIVQGFKVIG